MKLKDKVAIVTGAAQGIGREYALRFVEEGAAVALVDTRYEQAKAVELEITAKNGKALAIAGNVTNEAELAAMAKQVAEHFGRIDALVNNAAIYYDLELGRATLEYGRKVMDVNVFGVMLASWAVFPYMQQQRSGSIINIASIAAWPGAISATPSGPDMGLPATVHALRLANSSSSSGRQPGSGASDASANIDCCEIGSSPSFCADTAMP